MRKHFFAATLAVFALCAAVFTSCDKKPCESTYNWYYIVKNDTDREIVVSPKSDESEEGLRSVTLSPGNVRIVYDNWGLGSCAATNLTEDWYEDDDMILAGYYDGGEYGSSHYGYGNYYVYGKPSFTITVGGEEVAEEIWLRKHWTFEPRYYAWIYTLTVTDELLDEVGLATAE